jgi:hypothetical protein
MQRQNVSAGRRSRQALPQPHRPESDEDRGDEDEAPETPTDEPSPIPVQDPPSDDRPRPPMTVVFSVNSLVR